MSRDPLAANLRANVPGELRAVEGWVVWSWTDGKKEPDCAPDLSRHASSTDAAPGHLSTNASPSLSPATLTASDSRSTRSPMTSSCSTSTRRCPRSTGWRLLSRWTPTHRTVAIGRRTARRLPHEAERFRPPSAQFGVFATGRLVYWDEAACYPAAAPRRAAVRWRRLSSRGDDRPRRRAVPWEARPARPARRSRSRGT
jgi:hypothetical protein